MKHFLSFSFVLLLFSCATVKPLPTKQYYEFVYRFDQWYERDTLFLKLKNPLRCPLSVELAADSLNPDLKQRFGYVVLSELQDTLVKVAYPALDTRAKVRYIVNQGNPDRLTQKQPMALPFPKGRRYKILQGYEGTFTHHDRYSRYALDFALKTGDTISSADDGYVVGVIDGYTKYGTGKEWLEHDKSNYITVYHPHSGLFTQYVHLQHNGALVQLGDFVAKGQPIALSGMTGFTTTPHLHFNVKVPDRRYGLLSTETGFENGLHGKELQRKQWVQH